MIPEVPFARAFIVGVALGIVLGWLKQTVGVRIRHEVVAYDAVDMEHGRVHVVVVSNRLTGRMTRRVYARDD